jgi:hypothetical protein
LEKASRYRKVGWKKLSAIENCLERDFQKEIILEKRDLT